MSAETTLYGILAAAPSVTALVGSGAAARIYPDAMPEDCAYPALVYVRAGTDPIVTIDGLKHGEFATLSVQAWANTRGDADAVADAVELALLAAGEIPADRQAAYDPEMGLFAASLAVTLFV